MEEGKNQLSPYHKHPMLKICLLKFARTQAYVEWLRYLKTKTGHLGSEHKEVATMGTTCDFSDAKE